jgi:hypothetical protein
MVLEYETDGFSVRGRNKGLVVKLDDERERRRVHEHFRYDG